MEGIVPNAYSAKGHQVLGEPRVYLAAKRWEAWPALWPGQELAGL